MVQVTIFQCGAGDACFLQIWSGADETGALLATYNSNNPAPLNKNLVFGSKIFVKFTATSPAVRFLANWVCANGKCTVNILL